MHSEHACDYLDYINQGGRTPPTVGRGILWIGVLDCIGWESTNVTICFLAVGVIWSAASSSPSVMDCNLDLGARINSFSLSAFILGRVNTLSAFQIKAFFFVFTTYAEGEVIRLATQAYSCWPCWYPECCFLGLFSFMTGQTVCKNEWWMSGRWLGWFQMEATETSETITFVEPSGKKTRWYTLLFQLKE